MAPTSRTALETVVDYIKDEIERLNKLEEYLLTEFGPEDERLQVCLGIMEPLLQNHNHVCHLDHVASVHCGMAARSAQPCVKRSCGRGWWPTLDVESQRL